MLAARTALAVPRLRAWTTSPGKRHRTPIRRAIDNEDAANARDWNPSFAKKCGAAILSFVLLTQDVQPALAGPRIKFREDFVVTSSLTYDAETRSRVARGARQSKAAELAKRRVAQQANIRSNLALSKQTLRAKQAQMLSMAKLKRNASARRSEKALSDSRLRAQARKNELDAKISKEISTQQAVMQKKNANAMKVASEIAAKANGVQTAAKRRMAAREARINDAAHAQRLKAAQMQKNMVDKIVREEEQSRALKAKARMTADQAKQRRRTAARNAAAARDAKAAELRTRRAALRRERETAVEGAQSRAAKQVLASAKPSTVVYPMKSRK